MQKIKALKGNGKGFGTPIGQGIELILLHSAEVAKNVDCILDRSA